MKNIFYLLIVVSIIGFILGGFKTKCDHIYARVARMGAPSEVVKEEMFVCVKCYGTLIVEQQKSMGSILWPQGWHGISVPFDSCIYFDKYSIQH